MDNIPENANGEPIIFEMDLDIEEDVDTCLAEFVFLVRLGLHEDARHLAEKILWRHIGHFPVFAELAAFFITVQDARAASELIIDLAARRIVFAGTDEQEFLQMVALFARNRLYASTLAALTQKSKLKMESQGSENQARALCSPFLEIDYNSIAQLQNIEIRLYDILVVEQHGKLSDVVEFAIDHIQKLIELNLLREAAEIFLYLCIYLNNIGQTYDVQSLYSKLRELLEQRSKPSTANDELKDVLLTKTTVNTAIFIALRGKVQSLSEASRIEGIRQLYREIKSSTDILFSMIADTKPSRSLIDRLHERWHLREGPPLLEEYLSTQSRSDVSDATHIEHAQEKRVKPLDEKQNFDSTGNYFIQPDGPVYIQKPKRETYVQMSQEAVYVQKPQETVYVQSPQEAVYVQVPEQVTYVQQPLETVYVQRPKQITYVQAPEQATYVQSPKETVYVQTPEQVTYVQEPHETVYVQEPAQITYVQQPREAVHVHEPKEPVYIYEPEGDIHIYASKAKVNLFNPAAKVDLFNPAAEVDLFNPAAEVHLYKPAAEVHIHKPNQGIHVYELGDDAHIDSHNSLLHTHNTLDSGMPHAERELLPPYTADYKIPETIVLNQLQKLYEMGAIRSIIEKLPDPPEYTAPTSSTEMAYGNQSIF